jgi:hypothetical protein
MTLQIATPEIQGADSWVEVVPFLVGERLELPAKNDRMQLLAERVLAWNWVDQEGEPLPQPGGDQSVFREKLTTFEIVALTELVLKFPGPDDLKN